MERSLKWADWVHVTNVVSRWLDSGLVVVINTADIPAFCTLIREEVESVGGDKARGGGPKGKVSTQVTNTNYFGSLVGIFKDHKVKGKVVP